MADSYADALFPEEVDGWPVVPWMRGVTADGAMVGFVMLALATEHHPEPFLWRLLVDRMHQRRGIGSAIIELVAEECLRTGNETLLVSWSEGPGSPRDFYVRHGFVPTGRLVDGEIEARKSLA
jgi:diamine N-acetyltransferase